LIASQKDKKIISELMHDLKNDTSALEVPVAAAVYDSNLNLVSYALNSREINLDPTAHAEIEALRLAGKKIKSWNLSGLTLYVTLEPCLMCTGAIQQARISKVVFGAFSLDKSITSGSEILRNNNQSIEVVGGVCEEECAKFLTQWFNQLRQSKDSI
jgi:tRNA(adenine34) deaminase